MEKIRQMALQVRIELVFTYDFNFCVKTISRFFRQFSRPQESHDHELFRETNRRLIDMIEEAFELNIYE